MPKILDSAAYFSWNTRSYNATKEFTIAGHLASMRSMMKAASLIALSTKYPFAILGLFGYMTISFSAARIVAANKMANFLSSVIEIPEVLDLLQVERWELDSTSCSRYPKIPNLSNF